MLSEFSIRTERSKRYVFKAIRVGRILLSDCCRVRSEVGGRRSPVAQLKVCCGLRATPVKIDSQ
jgi:hypothetical protein